MTYCYDIEVYKNMFCVTFKDVKSTDTVKFIIYKQINDLQNLYTFINDKNKWFVGYNSYHYDNILLNYIYKYYQYMIFCDTTEICKILFDISQGIIRGENTYLKYNLPFQGIDIMRVGNIDYKSLKLMAINIKHDLVQDLPISWKDEIQDKDLQLILDYNLNDVIITEKLYFLLKDKIELRYHKSLEYNINLMNESDSGISNRLLEKFYSEETNTPIKYFKELRSIRPFVKCSDVIFDFISFRDAHLQEFLISWKKKVMKPGEKFEYNLFFKGLSLTFGAGGIHSNDEPGLFYNSDKEKLIDCDVNSGVVSWKIAGITLR